MTKKILLENISLYTEEFERYVELTRQLNTDISTYRSVTGEVKPILEDTLRISGESVIQAKDYVQKIGFWLSVCMVLLLVAVGAVTATFVWRLSINLRKSLFRLTDTVKEVGNGNYSARNNIDSNDELGELASVFDRMLDERVSTLAEAEKENERLNNSIIDLMESVADISSRDLTVTASVAEDVTGPVADAINMMATETAGVLKEIQLIATDVAKTAASVKGQGEKVSEVAKKENVIAGQTRQRLEQASRAMSDIAQLANKCNEIGSRASESTSIAMMTVSESAQGMSDVKQTISESEKRLKRLGERSQEISSVIEIINNIAERTQVLALNASMQAAAAGDAGRGFAVVANEVQRLAESSRQSTSEIEALVRNIQSDTSDAMLTMNKTIELVVDGADKAIKAGDEMNSTQKTTLELVNGVKHIARRSIEQVKVSDELQQQACILFEGTLETGQELDEQTRHTNNLTDFSDRLVQSVSVFKLPA